MKIRYIFNSMAVALGAAASLGAMSSCNDECPNYWDEYYGAYEEPTPQDKPAYIWIDAAANFPYVADSKENIDSYVVIAKDAGFTDLIVDVRPPNGDVLFNTSLIDPVTEQWTWKRVGNKSEYTAVTRTATWDYLQAWIDAAHAHDLRVHAALNTMVGGYYVTAQGANSQAFGMAFRDPSTRDMITTVNTSSGLVNQMDLSTPGERFLNPHNPKVKELILGLIRDVAKNYPSLDGIILDRGRFMDCTTDFSDIARTQFEEFIGKKLNAWPDDVMPLGAKTVPTSDFPPYYKEWWEFRAKTMHDIIADAADVAHQNNPGIKFGCYVGAWYASYYQNGVNWASPQFDPRVGTDASVWCSGNYMQYGYADHLDILILGCYTDPTAIFGVKDWTAQGFALNGAKRVMGATTVIGGPDMGDWPTENDNYLDKSKPSMTKDQFMQAAYDVVGACSGPLDGYFLFDIIHLQNSPQYWIPVKKALHGEPLDQ